jgi:hypothetical protein
VGHIEEVFIAVDIEVGCAVLPDREESVVAMHYCIFRVFEGLFDCVDEHNKVEWVVGLQV